MQYLLTCSCGRKLAVSKTQAGESIRCECGEQVTVPTLRGFADLPVVQSESVDAKMSRDDRAQSVWKGWRGTCFAIAIAIFAIAGITAARAAYIANAAYTPYDVEQEILAGNEKIDTASPEELSMILFDFQQVRLTLKDRPMFYRLAKYSEEQAFTATVAGVIAGVGLALAIGIWISAPKPKTS